MLAYLEEQNLFVVRMSGGALRYHRLFRDFLLQRARAAPEKLRERHLRAANYYAEQANWERAVHHYVEAEEFVSAAALLTRVSKRWIRGSRFDTLSYWVSRLPDAAIERFPALALQQGRACEARGRWDQALAWYDRAVRIYADRGDRVGVADALRRKGHIFDWRNGRYEEAERCHRQAFRYLSQGTQAQRAALLRSLSRTQLSAGHTEVALTLYREALSIYEGIHDLEGQLVTLLNPGSWLFHSLGEFRQALTVLHRARQLGERLESQHHLAECYNNLSVNLYFLWRVEEALAAGEEALALSRQIGDVHNEAFARMNLTNARSALPAEQADLPRGRTAYTTLLDEYEQSLLMEQAEGDRRFIIANLVFMSILARRHGDVAEARSRAKEALDLARDGGLGWLAGWSLVNLGAAEVHGNLAGAGKHLSEALELMKRCDDTYHTAMCYLWLDHLETVTGRPAAGRSLQKCLRLAAETQLDHLFRCEPDVAAPFLARAIEQKVWPAGAARILGTLGRPGMEHLLRLHTHEDVKVRRHILPVLAQMDDIRAARAVARAACAHDPQERAVARGALRQLNATEALPLVFRCFGALQVMRGDTPIPESAWRGQRARRLLRYLLISPDYALARDQVLERMWPALDPEAAADNLYRVVYDLRKALRHGSSHSPDYVQTEGEIVRLNAMLIADVDVTTFDTAVTKGLRCKRERNLQEARRALQQAVDLYSDDLFTDDLYDEWLAPERRHYRRQFITAAHLLSHLLAEAADLEEAIYLLRRAFAHDPADEQLCHDLMVYLTQAGKRAEALRQYAACKASLDDLALAPSRNLQELYYTLASSPEALERLNV